MTDALLGEKYVTISTVKPLLSHLLEKVLVTEDNDTDLMEEPDGGDERKNER